LAKQRTDDQLRVAIAGLGTIGTAVARLLTEERERYKEELGVDLRIVTILEKDFREKETAWLGQDILLTDSLEDFLKTPADVVVELLGGVEPAHGIISKTLRAGRAAVTANKLLIARHGPDYLGLAIDHSAYLGFEASVAGGIPIIRALRRSLIADRITRIRGILNGTCNFILTEMSESGRDFREVLAQAQALGYAEADPSLDVSGRDTADKLSILAALSFGKWVPPSRIPTRGISEIWPIDLLYARKLNSRIRLLGVGEIRNGEPSLHVSPFLVDNRIQLSQVAGVLNAIEVTGTRLDSAVFVGRGAGGNPTSVSVVADILNAGLWLQRKALFHSLQITPADAPTEIAAATDTADQERYPFYIRFFVKDQTGIISALSTILSKRRINIDSVLQESWPDPSSLPFIITIEPTPVTMVAEAVAEMSQLDFNKVPPLALPRLLDREWLRRGL
jgi:homoserine dehydrogenase